MIVDIEPESLPIDSWIFKNVSQILTQRPSPQILISPLFPSITSIKLSNHYVNKKKQHQIKSKHINTEKLKPNKEKIISSKAKKLHSVIHEMKKTNRYLKKKIYSLSLHEQHIVNNPTENKNDKLNNIEKNLKHNGNNHKSNSNSNSKSKQEDITDISRLSKNLQQNETIALYDKEIVQFQPLSNR